MLNALFLFFFSIIAIIVNIVVGGGIYDLVNNKSFYVRQILLTNISWEFLIHLVVDLQKFKLLNVVSMLFWCCFRTSNSLFLFHFGRTPPCPHSSTYPLVVYLTITSNNFYLLTSICRIIYNLMVSFLTTRSNDEVIFTNICFLMLIFLLK